MSESAEVDAGHLWIRTVPTDGRWCEGCGLPEAQWGGGACAGVGAARAVEARMMRRLAAAWARGYMAADPDADPIKVAEWNPYPVISSEVSTS